VPHVVCGVAGRPFQSPFAKPPGEGLSSSTVNVLWGACNLVIGYWLIVQVGHFYARDPVQAGTAGLGALFIGLMSARLFGRFHGGNLGKN